MEMVQRSIDRECPSCRLKRVLAWIDQAIEPHLFPDSTFDPRINPDAGREVMRRIALGIPMDVGRASKPSKYLFEEGGGRDGKKKRKSTKSGNARRKSMSKNLKIVNARARKKNGDLKKGWTQSRIMSTAHRMTRKDCK